MSGITPLSVITTLVEARDAGDIDNALRCYDPHVTIVTREGSELTGTTAARAALIDFVSLAATFTVHQRRILAGSDTVALHYSQWTLSGQSPDGPFEVSGTSTDVLARQPGGDWLLVIDNPYGIAVIDQEPL